MKKIIAFCLSAIMTFLLFAVSFPAVMAENVLFETNFGGKPYDQMAIEGQEKVEYFADKSCGADYTLDTVINIKSINDGDGRGVKFMLRDCKTASSGKMELWLSKKAIWVCTDSWKNMQSFDATPYFNKDLNVRIILKGDYVCIALDNKVVWECTDASVGASTEAKLGMGSWDASYTISSIKVTPPPETVTPANPAPSGGTAGGAAGGAAGDANKAKETVVAGTADESKGILYQTDFGGKPYDGMNKDGEGYAFSTDKDYGADIGLEANLKINSVKDGDGRGIKFVIRSCKAASSGDMEIWLGKTAIWACTDSWKNMQSFDITQYIGKEMTVLIVVKGDSVSVNIDGVEIWTAVDSSFAGSTASKIKIGGWDAMFEINSVKILSAEKAGVAQTPDVPEEIPDETPAMGGKSYYVDSSAKDGGDGLSEDTAWNKIEDINNFSGFLPDDKILLKCGSVFEGVTMEPKGYGVKDHPITIDSYGKGDMPVLDRKGEFVPGGTNGTSTIKLTDQSYWTIKNIKISNHNPQNPGTLEEVAILSDHAELPMRNGIHISVSAVNTALKKIVRGIVVENVVFDGIDGSNGDEGNCYKYRVNENQSCYCGGGALCIRATDKGSYRSYIDGISVKDCKFNNVGGIGISTESGWKYNDSFSNVVIQNNRFICDEDFPETNHGMYVVSAAAPVIEYNSVENMSNGICVQYCTDAVLQYNTIVNSDGYLHSMSKYMGSDQHWDGVGIDADTNCLGKTTFRCNYTELCYSGAYGFFDYQDTPAAEIVVENNISYNDAKFMYYQCDNASYDFEFTNNTVTRTADSKYADEKKIINIFNTTAPKGALEWKNNVFYYPDQKVRFDKASSVYSGNLFVCDATAPKDSDMLSGEPLVVLPAKASDTQNISYKGDAADTDSFYKKNLFGFEKKSPCVEDGKVICGADLSVFFAGNYSGEADTVKAGGTSGRSFPWMLVTAIAVFVLVATGTTGLLVYKKKSQDKKAAAAGNENKDSAENSERESK